MIKPQRSIYIEFSDESGNGLTDAQETEMVGRMRKISNEYGYDFSSSGDEKSMEKCFASKTMRRIQDLIIRKIGK